MVDNNGASIVSALNLISHSTKLRNKTSAVIRKDSAEVDEQKVKVIGGDSRDLEHNDHPAIVIEKNGDVISKIIVRCPCGRHSELICEYDESEDESEENDLMSSLNEAVSEFESSQESIHKADLEAEQGADEHEENHYSEETAQEMAERALGSDQFN